MNMKMSIFLIISILIYGCSGAQTPPIQATSGPGGSDYIHDTVTVYNYGTGDEGFWLMALLMAASISVALSR